MAEAKKTNNRERINVIVERTCNNNGANERRVIINSEIPLNESTGEYFLEYDLAGKQVQPAPYCNDRDSVTLCFKNSGRKIQFSCDEIFYWTADNASGTDLGKTIKDPEISGICQFEGNWRVKKNGKTYDVFKIRLKPSGLLTSSDGTSDVEPAWN